MGQDQASAHDGLDKPLGDSPKALRFEDAIEALETIIDQIESGEMGLEKNLACYEQGMKLIERCRSILGATEKKIAELAIDTQGHPRVTCDDAGDQEEP